MDLWGWPSGISNDATKKARNVATVPGQIKLAVVKKSMQHEFFTKTTKQMYKKTNELYGLQRRILWKICVVMKLTIILTAFLCLNAQASVFAQRLSLQAREKPIKDVLLEIKNKTGYDFLFNNNILIGAKPVTVNLKNASLKEVLDACLEGQALDYEIEEATVLLKRRPAAKVPLQIEAVQSRSLRGKIRGSSGEILADVTVRNLTSGYTTASDQDGWFEVPDVKINDELSFSRIGYAPYKYKVVNYNEQAIVLSPEDQDLDEVLVVGYGTQRRESVTGSVAQISAKEIMQSPVGNITNMITGKLPGLISRQDGGEPGADESTLRIRGNSSFASSNAPVVIVDGVRRSFTQIDPEEIETITILKDASAAAVYGLQAAAGVILVTTKKGKSGKPSVRFNHSSQISENTMFPEFLDGPEYAYWYNKARMINGKDPLFSNADIRKMVEGDPEGKWGNTNWVNELFKTGQTSHSGVSVEGKNDKISYYFYGGYYNQNGNVKNINFDRYNLRSNIEVSASENLKVQIGVGGRKSQKEAPTFSTEKNTWNNIFQQAMRAHPYLPKEYDGYPTGNRTNGPLVSPISALEQSGFRKNYTDNFQSNLRLDLDMPFVTEGLSSFVMGSYDYTGTFAKAFQTPYLMAQGVVGPTGITYQVVDSSIGKLAKLAENMSRSGFLTLQAALNYNRRFDKHNVSGLVLFEQFRTLSNNFSISTQGLDFTELPELRFANELTPGTGAFNGGSSNVPSAGFVGRLNYDFANKYLLEVSGRYDGSYKFSQERRWALFPAVSIGWRLSEEDFFKDALPYVNDLKIRGSVGKLGNDTGVSAYAFLSTMAVASSDPSVVIGNTAQNAYITSALSNPDLSWETVNIYNVGLEASLWNNKLGFEIDAFYKLTDHILETQGGTFAPSMGGYFPSVVNTGKTDNRGFEFAINHRHRLGEFNYGARLNVSYYRNRYLNVRESANTPDHLKRNGRPLGEKHGLVALGIFQTDEEAQNWPSIFGGNKAGDIKYLDVNGDGKLTYNEDRSWIAGSNMPQLIGGLSLFGDYKGFDFSVMLQGAAKSSYALSGYYPEIGYDNTEFTTPFFQEGNAPRYLVENMWTPDNPNAKYPRLSDIKVQNNKWASSMWIVDGSYLRVKTAQIGYTLPKRITKKVGMESLRFNVSGGNLFTWTEFKYLDPEAPDVSNGFYPQQRIYSFGIDVKF